MNADTARRSLLRAVPELDPLMITDEVARLVLDHADRPSLLSRDGAYKTVLDLGNSHVAKIFRTYHSKYEDPASSAFVVTAFRLQNVAAASFLRCNARVHVEIQPRLTPMSHREAAHLVAVLNAHGLTWMDDYAGNGGVTTDAARRLLIFDGGIALMPRPDQVKSFMLSVHDHTERIACLRRRDGELFFFRFGGDPNCSVDDLEMGPWIVDQSLGTYFQHSPAATGRSLRVAGPSFLSSALGSQTVGVAPARLEAHCGR